MMSGANHPGTIFVTMHKAASSFVAGSFGLMLGKLLPGLEVVPFGYKLVRGVSAEAMAVASRGMVLTRVYPEHIEKVVEREVSAQGRFAEKKLIVVRRDPRDVAVSMYYSTAYSHPVPPGQESWFVPLRARLQSMEACEGVKFHTAKQAIEEFRTTTGFLSRHGHAVNAPYELLVREPEQWIDRVGEALGWDGRVRSEMSGLARKDVAAPQTENIRLHKRRVTPGNWREVFDDELREMFEREIGEMMSEAEYGWESEAAAARW